MIISFRHKGLQEFYVTGKTMGIHVAHAKRLRMLLAALDTAQTIQDMGVPSFKLHPLRGKLKGRWAVSVSGNWRLTFEFRQGNAYQLDYEDYH